MKASAPSRSYAIDTLAVHAGQPPDPVSGAVMTPIVLASTFAQSAPGEHQGYEYSRSGNPTRNALEGCVAALEGGRHGFAFSSGSVRRPRCSARCRPVTTSSPGTTSTGAPSA
jgi:cystathionine beta-lyase/cystathionine gamma-synthase